MAKSANPFRITSPRMPLPSLRVVVGSDGMSRVQTVYGDTIAMGKSREDAVACIPVEYREYPVR